MSGIARDPAVQYKVHTTLGADYEIVVSDPSVVEISRAARFGKLTVRALRAGSVSLIARTMTGEPLTERSLVTADIATIDFLWRAPPVASEPITALAGLAGWADGIGVAFRDTEGELLAGGALVTVDDPAIVTRIVVDPPWIQADSDHTSFRFGLLFRNPGTATATVTLFDGRTASLPIESVTEPATLEVIILRYVEDGAVRVSVTASIDELLSATIVGRTADGRHVAGVEATWTGSSSVTLLFGNGSPEVQFQLVAAGDATITANVGDKLATAQLSAR